jgi:hypothetical protein
VRFDELVEVDPQGHGSRSIGRIEARLVFKKTDATECDLALHERIVSVEADDIDLRPRDGREPGRERKLFAKRHRAERENGDVEVASSSRASRGLRTEEHGEA